MAEPAKPGPTGGAVEKRRGRQGGTAASLPEDANAPVIDVRGLHVTFPTDDGLVRAVDDVSFSIAPGETLGIVGESGSGKTVTSLAILGLLPKRAQVTGEIRFRGRNLVGLPEKQLQTLRGSRIAMIFQDALASLNPVFKVGDQIAEAIAVHGMQPPNGVPARVIELLDLVGIPNAEARATQYPHEFSGGMRQRAMIAMAIANEPDLIIADEPTTALDVTIQAQVLDVLKRIQERTASSILLITHDLGVVAGVADRVMVMYAGRQAEVGTVEDVFYTPEHAYTRGLIASLPRLDRRRAGEKLHRIKGQPPSLIFLPPGCAFNPRCPFALPGRCDTDRPTARLVSDGHIASCHFAGQLDEMAEQEVAGT